MASKVDLLKRERDDLRKLADHWKFQYDEYKGLNARLCAEVDAAAEMLREVKTQNAALRAEVEKLRAALEPLACTCDRPNGAACSRSEADCPFWNARTVLEGK